MHRRIRVEPAVREVLRQRPEDVLRLQLDRDPGSGQAPADAGQIQQQRRGQDPAQRPPVHARSSDVADPRQTTGGGDQRDHQQQANPNPLADREPAGERGIHPQPRGAANLARSQRPLGNVLDRSAVARPAQRQRRRFRRMFPLDQDRVSAGGQMDGCGRRLSVDEDGGRWRRVGGQHIIAVAQRIDIAGEPLVAAVDVRMQAERDRFEMDGGGECDHRRRRDRENSDFRLQTSDFLYGCWQVKLAASSGFPVPFHFATCG